MPTNYPYAKLISFLTGIIGWALMLGGAGGLAIAIPSITQGGIFSLGGGIALGGSAVALLMGLLFLSNSQSMRAHIDTADSNREMLSLMRRTVPVGPPPLPSDLPVRR